MEYKGLWCVLKVKNNAFIVYYINFVAKRYEIAVGALNVVS